MPSNRSTRAKRASAATDPAELRAVTRPARSAESPAADSVAGRSDGTDEASGRPAQRRAVKEAMARQNIRATRSPGAVGPIGRALLLIALFALVGLIAVWVLLAL